MSTRAFLARTSDLGLIGAISGLLVLGGGCSSGPGPPAARTEVDGAKHTRRPDIYLITIDTLRADRMSLYGHYKPTTPFLDSLRRDSVRFDRAYSTSSWTLPAVVSLLTGLEPTVHGVNRGFVGNSGKIVYQEVAAPDLSMLPERLRQAGYHTVGITANAHLDPGFGFSQGFDDYRCIGFADAEQLHLEIRRALAANPPSDTPRFVWVHYLDPHWPYYDHEESPAAIRADIPRLQSYLFPLLERFSSAEEFYAAGIRENDHVLRHALALYDGEIYHVDQHVARLFEMLQVQTHDLVIVTADHGEQFLDHGEVGHANTLFEETVRVPLLARFPRRAFAGQTVRTPVSLVDVVPTVLDYLGLEPPAPSSGRSLLPLLRGEDFPPRPIRASLSINVPLEAVILGNLKYIQDPNDPAREWLFDLSADHGERHDLAQVDRQDASRMHQLLTESIALAADSSFETVSVELDDERTAKLRSLGYLR